MQLFPYNLCVYNPSSVLIVSEDQKIAAERIMEYLEKEGLLFSEKCADKGKKIVV